MDREKKMLLKIDLKLLFDGYCKNVPNIYDEKYHWTKIEGLTWLTHSILRFFRGLGESMGFDVALDKQNIGSVSLKSRGDLFWVKDGEPVLHLECENAYRLRDIIEELENLGSSTIPFKVGIFQLADKSLTDKTVGRMVRFLKKKNLVKNGTKWLLIFDSWSDTKIKNVNYTYKDPKTFKTVDNEYALEWNPLFGVVLGERTDKTKVANIYRLPFDKIGVIESDWERIE